MTKKPAKKAGAKKPPAKKAAPKAAAKARAPKAAAAKAKTRNEPNDDQAPAVAGGNMASLSADQKRAIFLNHVAMLDAAQRAVAKAKKKESEVKALIKTEGGDVKRTQQGIRLMASDDRAAERVRSEEIKIRRDIEATLIVAGYVGSDLGQGQIDWLDGLMPATDRAFDEGKMAGLQAGPRKPPYDPSVPQYRRWMEGFDEGQAVLKSKFVKAAGGDKKDTQPQLIFDVPEPPKEEVEEPAKKASSKASSKPKNKGRGGDKKSPGDNDGGEGPENEPSKPAGQPVTSKTPAPTPETGPELDAQPPTPPEPPEPEPSATDLQMGGTAPEVDGATKH